MTTATNGRVTRARIDRGVAPIRRDRPFERRAEIKTAGLRDRPRQHIPGCNPDATPC
jgi:hypothetical protein